MSPQKVIAQALSKWYGDDPAWFTDHGDYIIAELDREGYEIREKEEQ